MIFEKIGELCKERGISVYQLEKDCGFGNGTIGKWRFVSPTADKLKRVADYLGCSVDYLLKEN